PVDLRVAEAAMSGGVEVEPESLRGHSGEVREQANRTGNAAQAAHHLASLDDAYGLICRGLGLPELLRQPQETAAGALDNLQGRLQDSADKLTRAPEEYQPREIEYSRRLTGLAVELDSAVQLPSLGGGNGESGGAVHV